MESTESISKGCFIFKKPKSKFAVKENEFNKQLWYNCYKNEWNNIEDKIKILCKTIYMNVLKDVIEFVKQTNTWIEHLLPTAILLTGINQPDLLQQINRLTSELKSQITPHIAVLFSRDCLNIKNTVENMVMQFLQTSDSGTPNSIRKYQYNMPVLKSWYENCYAHNHPSSPSKKQKTKPAVKPFVIIVPDFESFNTTVLQDFILLLSGYSHSIPFVLLFGVATSISMIHKSLPHHITSKMFLQIFSSQSSQETLHQILENILLDPMCTFHLSGCSLKLLVDVFMFYDLSIEGFLNSLKYCMLHHYSNYPAAIICSNKYRKKIKSCLRANDIEEIRKLLSFRHLVESQEDCQMRINLLLKDESVYEILPKLLANVQHYLKCFHLNLKILFELTFDLPQAPLGDKLHKLYIKAMSTNITLESEFIECIPLVKMLSKTDFIKKICNIIHLLETHKSLMEDEDTLEVIDHMHRNLTKLQFENISNDTDFAKDINLDLVNINKNSMREIREVLIHSLSKQKKGFTAYEQIKTSIIEFLIECFKKYLKPVDPTLPLFELFIFTDYDSIKEHMIGSPRATLHTALNSPNYYLQCSCCATEVKDEIISTMPDTCIGYKLHLECGRMINLYDWLHAFNHVTSVNLNLDKTGSDILEDQDDIVEIEPEIQARFTSLVSELQHLGFIKSSNRKRDHVTRLTW